jgi:putative NADH-flavin reductase
MKLIIFGSTGSIGRQLVVQALALEHEVTAFTRNPQSLNGLEHPNLSVFQGDVFDSAAVERAIKNQEIVLCTLGAGRKGSVRAEGTLNIIRAMEKTGVRRFICQTTLGAGDSKTNLNFFWRYIMFGFLLRKAYLDHELQEKYIIQSRLDWTIVRPAAFTDGKATGNYRHGFAPTDNSLKLKKFPGQTSRCSC